MSRTKRAVVVTPLALIALCGFAFASGALPTRSAGTPQLRPHAVTHAQLSRHPAARLESSTRTLSSGALSRIAFDRVAFDTGHMAAPGGSVLRAPRRGIYDVDAGLRFPADSRGIRALMIAGPGGALLAAQEDSANSDPARSTIYTISTLVKLRRGDKVSALGVQNTGGPMNLVADDRSFLAMHRASP